MVFIQDKRAREAQQQQACVHTSTVASVQLDVDRRAEDPNMRLWINMEGNRLEPEFIDLARRPHERTHKHSLGNSHVISLKN